MKNFKDEFIDTFVDKLKDSRKMHKAIMDIVDEGRTKKLIIGAGVLLITLGSIGVFVGKVYVEKTIENNRQVVACQGNFFWAIGNGWTN